MKKLSTLLLGMLMIASSYAALPAKVFAPYVDVMLWPTPNIMSFYNASGQKYYTLAFIISGPDNKPAWGGALGMNTNHMLDQINQLRAAGGDVIVSFGGANGTPIDASITDVNTLANTYEAIINQYGLTWIDFDIEGWWVQDQASIDRRNKAAKILQSRKPSLRITYCLPVMPFGLTADGVNIINKAKAEGVNIYGVNVMAMDYGQSNQQMGQAAISAAQNTRNQTNLNIGITPMIGKNDTQNETFSLSNANEVMTFAKNTSWVNMIAMWSVNRDNGGCPNNQQASPTCSGISQSQYAFTNIFKPYSGGGGGGGCTPTPISPYISVNGGSWQSTFSVTVSVGANVTIGPQPLNGTWSWSGPNGFSSASRQITRNNIQSNQGGGYTASYTNPQGCLATATFTITVTGGGGGGGGCSGVPQYVSGGSYNAGSVVQNGGSKYQCRPWPNSGWCSAGGAYTPGVGFAWQDAWTLVGSCAGRMVQPELSDDVSFEANGLSMYPHPGVSGKAQSVTFTFDKNPAEVSVYISDMNGSEITSQQYKDVNHTVQFEMPSLPKGMYIVKVQEGKKMLTKKYIIK
jgi:hypothetical protein